MISQKYLQIILFISHIKICEDSPNIQMTFLVSLAHSTLGNQCLDVCIISEAVNFFLLHKFSHFHDVGIAYQFAGHRFHPGLGHLAYSSYSCSSFFLWSGLKMGKVHCVYQDVTHVLSPGVVLSQPSLTVGPRRQ